MRTALIQISLCICAVRSQSLPFTLTRATQFYLSALTVRRVRFCPMRSELNRDVILENHSVRYVIGVRYLMKLPYMSQIFGQRGLDSVDPDQTPQNAASDQGLHCLSFIHQFVDTSTGCRIDLFSF